MRRARPTFAAETEQGERLMEIQRVAVIGSGQMGTGIAQLAARAGLETVLFKMTEGPVDAGKKKIAKALARDVEKKRCTQEEVDEALGRIECSNRINDLAECHLIVESIVEDME